VKKAHVSLPKDTSFGEVRTLYALSLPAVNYGVSHAKTDEIIIMVNTFLQPLKVRSMLVWKKLPSNTSK